MKFFSSKIVTKPISLEDAVKNAKPLTVRSLDEIIASAKQVKTAAAATQEVKTASTESKVETSTVQIKLAADFAHNPAGNIALDPMAKKEPEIIGLNPAEDHSEIGHGFDKMKFDATAPKDMVGGTGQALTPEEGAAGFGAKKWETGAYPVKPADAAQGLQEKIPMTGLKPAAPAAKPAAPAVPAQAPMAQQRPAPVAPAAPAPMPAMASGKKQLKIASKINFTQWADPKQVVDAWQQHGTVEACVKNVAGQTNDPQTYCSLLRVAASEAGKMVKAASEKKPAVTAKKEEAKAAPMYKKIAKLTGEEQSFLREFFSKIYGKDYVDAMLGDY